MGIWGHYALQASSDLPQPVTTIIIVLSLIIGSILALMNLIMTNERRENIIMSLSASGEWKDLPRSSRKRPRMGLLLGFLILSGLLTLGVALVDGFGWFDVFVSSLVGTVLLIHMYYLSLAHAHPIECSGRRTGLPYETVVEAVERVLLEKRMNFSGYYSGRYRGGPMIKELRKIQRYLETGNPDGSFYKQGDRFIQVRDLSSEQGMRVHVKLFYDGSKDGPWVDLMKKEIDMHLDGIPLNVEQMGQG